MIDPEKLELPNHVGSGLLRTAASWMLTLLLSEEGKQRRVDMLRDVMKEAGITTEHIRLMEEKFDVIMSKDIGARDDWDRRWDEVERGEGE